ncbi:MAG TPA: thiamine pyrophosphate-binding protein [Hyphomicrobiaceae bacterium]|nr:thiamine pyrophosphate-binding protein [Hyphomicrobiaceae bacterium]
MVGRSPNWSEDVLRALEARSIMTVCTIPDGGLTQLLKRIEAGKGIRLVTLSTEEEGIGIATGCWLAGTRAMVAMQSSGVGNCINALGLPAAFRAPCLLLVTMRGQWGEFNPWQVPMGQAVRPALEAVGVKCYAVDKAEEIGETFAAAADFAFNSRVSAAVLIGQRVIGAKGFGQK